MAKFSQLDTFLNSVLKKLPKGRFSNRQKAVLSTIIGIILVAIFVAVTRGHDMPVLDTHGLIANKERGYMFIVLGLAVIVVVPTFIMLFAIAWKYRASNTKATYEPDFESSVKLEALWWGIPCLIILLLAVLTSFATHALDPYKAIDSGVKPVNIQVVSLQWKWLFIYPDQHIATVNYLNIPKNTPINMTITSDAPMNSFWVPALAGQVYAMSGMSTQLHLMADTVGSYKGESANISGEGFAKMNFVVNSQTSSDFKKWANNMGQNTASLDSGAYDALSKPSATVPINTYVLTDNSLYNDIIMKYMPADSSGNAMQGMSM